MTDAIRSIRLRLVVSAILTILFALTAAGWGLLLLFEHHVERRTVNALQDDIGELIAGVTVANDGTLRLARTPLDPRYLKPLSGTYWQVIVEGRVVQRSRSLWDETLSLPLDKPEDGHHEHIVRGPQGQTLIAVERAIRAARPAGNIEIRFIAAQDRADTMSAVASFRTELTVMLLVLGASLLAAFAIAIAVGLAPFRRLREDLAALRSGATRRLVAGYPSEVDLLVGDLNALLDERDKDAERKRQRAADLAHGLKTPLTAIVGISDDLAARGLNDHADELANYAASMLRHVERELAMARSVHAGPGTPPTPVRPIIDGVVRSLRRAPGGRDLEWEIDVPKALSLRIDQTALAEILGGPLDNARKFATSRVAVQARAEAGRVTITIADDGPGVGEDKIPSLTQRGKRLDRRKSGSGLGLTIASDIATELDGTLTLSNAPDGGFLVTLVLPVERASNL
jgi:signal transduction histidine kinase